MIILADQEIITNTTTPLGVRGVIESLLTELLRELQVVLPQIFVALIIVLIILFLARYLNKFVRSVLKYTGIEDSYKKISVEPPRIPLSDLVLVVVDVGLFLLAATIVLRIFLSYDPVLINSIIDILWRFGSFIIIMLIFMTGLDLIIRITNFERKTEILFYLIALFLGVSLIIDLTNLSQSIKSALAQGIAVGIGISISVFIIWLFFGEYIERYLSSREKESGV
ncbi:MAG: hypothetical protein ABWJ42_05850 [Sulfolobales archaeon]